MLTPEQLAHCADDIVNLYAQLEEVSSKKNYHNFEELLLTNDTWEVK